MKKIIAIACMAWIALAGAWADNISAEDITLQKGETKTVDISLTNTESDLVSFQIDLTLPEGISINKAGCSLSNRISDPDQELAIGKQGNNVYRIASTSFALTPISGTSGTLLTLSLTAAENSQGGTATLSNIRFITSNSERVTISDASFNIDFNITFADANVKALCVQNWDTNGDGELSEAEAAAVTDLGTVFKENTTITSFDELQYFTGLTSIGNEAFKGCTGLTSITIPNSVTSIGRQAFEGCSGLTSVAIPNSVTSIRSLAFSGCSGLTSVTIPNSVTSIGSLAFMECSSLTSITIPNSVTSIGGSAFSYCSGLTEVFIPNSVTSIGSGAFSSCSSLTSMKVENGNTKYDSRNNCNAIIETASNKLIAGCENTVIPNSVTSIGDYAFYGCSGLTSITIPNSVTSIGEGAFYGCSGLTSITIPNFVTSIGNYAFSGCSGLTSITIPNSVTSIGEGAFSGCSGLTSVTIPNSVTNIGNYAFANCCGLKSVTIPNSVTSVGEGAFFNCSGLTSVTIPSSVTNIGNYAFAYCSGLKSVTIPNSVTSIGNYAFAYCTGLTSVTVGIETPLTIAENTFSNRANATLYVPAGCKAAYEAADYWKEFKEIIEMTDVSPVIWQEWLTSDGKPIIPNQATNSKWMGDAETPWANPNVRWDDQTQNYLICAWSMEKGVNMDAEGDWHPFPATIEREKNGNHYFVVHGQPATSEGEASSWDNRFWIQSPKAWKAGTQVKVHFRYKASQDVSSTYTHINMQNPSIYLTHHAIGDIHFTTEWQEFNGIMTIENDMAHGWSIAFCLNPVVKDAVDFYFDDLSWQTMVLDEGWFIASSNTENGIGYDYDNAIELEKFDEGIFTATVGTQGKPDTWVNEVMISTVRGDELAFKGATITAGTSTNIVPYDPETEEGAVYGFTEKSGAKIALPAAGVWQILLFPDIKNIAFVQIEGDAIVVKDPVDIVTNATEIVVNATERQDLKDDLINGVLIVKEEADDPAGVEVGGEGHEGQPWDNQFWIAANRDLKADEVTVLKFKYKASKAARTSTQAHKVGDDGKPFTYLNWQAIGDVNFTEEWQDFETTFTVPAGDDGMRSIVFNMAEIKEACDYYIKDVQWYVKDEALEAQGKTMENLINADGTSNFYVKEGAGTSPYEFVALKPTDISQLDNAIYVEPVETVPNCTYALNIKAKNDVTVLGMGFTLTLPDEFSLITDKDGIICTLDPQRASSSKFTVISSQDGNSYSFRVMPISTTTISGNDGTVLTVRLKNEDAELGRKELKISNSSYSVRNDDNSYETHALVDFISTIDISDEMIGDVNSDGYVDLTDAIMIVNHSLNNTPSNFKMKVADVNGDGNIDLTDAIIVVNMSLNISSHARQAFFMDFDPE